jgi:hypothetical protein
MLLFGSPLPVPDSIFKPGTYSNTSPVEYAFRALISPEFTMRMTSGVLSSKVACLVAVMTISSNIILSDISISWPVNRVGKLIVM